MHLLYGTTPSSFRRDARAAGEGKDMQIAVTGANGFVGDALCTLLRDAGHDVTSMVRRAGASRTSGDLAAAPGASSTGSTSSAGRVRECVVPEDLAVRVYMMCDAAADPLAAYRATNVDGGLNASAERRAGAGGSYSSAV